MRLACLYVPDFPLAALLRAQPELQGEAVAVADECGPRARLLAVSVVAARRGVTSGCTAAQAATIAAGVVVRCVSPDTLRAAQAALCDAAASFSPRIEDSGGGLAYLDLEGLGALYDSESQLANAVARRAAALGMAAQVGVAGSKVAAYLAARQGGGVAVVPPGEEAGLLAPVPVALLEPSVALAVTLRRWGIRCIGDLAALPSSAVGARLGPEGVALVRRARGEDASPLAPRSLPLHFAESADLDYGLETVEPFLFVLRGLLDRLTARLAVRGFLCGDLRLSLRLATRGRDERTVAVGAPSNDVKALLALVRLHLEGHPPAAAVEGLRVLAVPERLRAAQLDLFRPHGPAPAHLAVTLARLAAICGADRIGAPAVPDTHRPEAYGVTTFEKSTGLGGDAVCSQPLIGFARQSDRSLDTAGEETPPTRDERKSASELPPLPIPPSRRPFLAACRGGHFEFSGEAPITPNPVTPSPIPLALRAVRPPQAVEVFCERDRPAFVRGARFAGRVVHAAGPWRVHGEWWRATRYARDYYDVQLSDGCVYRLYCDLPTQSWFVAGVYD